MQVTDSFLYEKEKDGAVILRCFLRDGKVEVPERLDSLPVTALAPYAFSAQMEAEKLPGADPTADGQELVKRAMSKEALCGESLRELVLPASLTRVGKYCFYNCENLESLQYANPSVDWGSGAFAGCHGIHSIRAEVRADEAGTLQHLLQEVSEELTLLLGDAFLVFPDFYEEAVENTPARILQTQVHGTGILYRNCFQNGKFDFAQYDSLFPYAQAQESEALLAALVIGRLRFPYALKEEAKAQYLAYGKEHLFLIGKTFLQTEDSSGLSWFLETFAPLREDLDRLCSEASAKKEAQLQGILMEYRHAAGGAMTGRKRFIL